jgi:organic radical activating enzyme
MKDEPIKISLEETPILVPDPDVMSYPELLSPMSAHLRLSAKCNYTCFFCEREAWRHGDKPREEDMKEDVWNAVRDKIVPNVLGVEVCGLGEPTLSPLFAKVCKDVTDAGKVLYFPTNGTTLGNDDILDAIGDAPRVSVSLDAWDEDSYKRIRGGDWKQIEANIKKFRKAKPNAFLHSQFTAGQYNIDGFPQFVAWAIEMGFNEVIMRSVQTHSISKADASLRFAKDRTEKAIVDAWLTAKDSPLALHVERRPYSEFLPNSAGDASPITRLRQHLEYVPLQEATCPVSVSCATWYTGTDYSTTSGFHTYSMMAAYDNGFCGAWGRWYQVLQANSS